MLDHQTKYQMLGASVPRLEDAALLSGTAASSATSLSRTSCTCASCARRGRTGASSPVDTAAARALPGVFAVWTSTDIATCPRSIFATDSRGARALSPTSPGSRARALCRRSGRGGVCRGPLSRRGRRRSRRDRDRGSAGASLCAGRARRIRARPLDRSDRAAHSYGDIDAPSRMPMRSSNSISTSAAIPACRWRPAARSAVMTPRATCSSFTARQRCRTAIATRFAGMLDRSPSALQLHEAHVGGGFGMRGELYPEDVLVCVAAMRFRRPVKWIEDRREHLMCRQSFAPAAASRADGRRCGRPHSRHR